MDRALASGAKGHRFESCTACHLSATGAGRNHVRFAFVPVILAFGLLVPDGAMAQVPLESRVVQSTTQVRERLGGPLGVGVCLGAPTGLTAKYWIGSGSGVQVAFGGAIGQFKSVAATADYVLEFRPINVEGDDFALPVHVGAGAKANFDFNQNGGFILLGPRVVAGVTLLVPTLPVDLHVEVAPVVYLIEEPGWGFDGQMGVRYYF